ncbi:MAG: fused MFS/spermidine synthase [Verrucomicrobiota bacterium]
MNLFTRRVLFVLFFFSGFSSLVYQVVWTRMAFASFGIITPVLSVVLSIFMLGLALGSWAGGRYITPLTRRTGLSAACFYAGAESLIGLGAFAVPRLFAISERILLPTGQMDSAGYLFFSALALAVSIFPWCICMGTTLPFMMAFIREQDRANTGSFSFLYVANVLGAMTGTFYTAVVLVEQLGFHHTLWIAAASNFIIAFISGCLAWEQQRERAILPESSSDAETIEPLDTAHKRFNLVILFSTGFIAMAMEVIWSRAFAVTLKTEVYSFASIVFTYLGATCVGSIIYRWARHRNRGLSKSTLFPLLAIAALLPVLTNDPRFVVEQFWSPQIDFRGAFILLFSICPFCGLLGYLTPSLIDEASAGQPRSAGRVYAINVLGCILGPLAGCYLLLPLISERGALILLGIPFIVFWLMVCKFQVKAGRISFGLALLVILTWCACFSEDFEDWLFKHAQNVVIRRDYAASVASVEYDGRKHLVVNGFGMTTLTPITKFIAHLPLAYHQGKAESMLVICFGMGTTYRSALSWGIDTTVVELVPSVTKAFAFYHEDAGKFLNDPNGHIIIDDGRRYLNRCARKYDVIVVDPPPPVEAAGSSLLFSRQFYELAKQHLNTNGIVQMWFPGSDILTTQAVLRSIAESFPYVRCFPSVEGWGLHFLGSMEPIPELDAKQLVTRMPIAAQQDMLEWADTKDAVAYFNRVTGHEYSISGSLNSDPTIQVTDDQPYNEYYLLRWLKSKRSNP